MQIAIVVFDGFDELDAIGPYEVLRHAARGGADIDVSLVTLGDSTEVVASGGLIVRPHATLAGTPDVVLLPGGPGAYAEAARGELPRAVRELHRAGSTVATVCTGAMLAVAAGLTAGRRATTHHGALAALRDSGAEVVEARVVDDGDLMTAGGVTCGLDLALWLVEREFGAPLAEAVAANMEYVRPGVSPREGARPPVTSRR